MMRTIFIALMVFLGGCATGTAPVREAETPAVDPDQLLVVDCQLPGQIRKLGQNFSYLAPRRAIKTTGVDCEIRGGEYVAYDRANYATALKVWLPQAKQGDPEAQAYVGEIYEKGLGVMADYKLAHLWYSKAAEQGNSRAQINLGYLYEAGLGVERNLVTAMNWYRKASGLSDAELEYVSSLEVARREAAQHETAELKQEVQGLRAQLDQNRKTLAQRKQGLATAEKELAALRVQIESSQPQIAVPRQDVQVTNVQEDLESRLREARGEQERLLAKLAKQELESGELRGQVRRLVERIDVGNRNLDKAYKELTQARVELARLKSRGNASANSVQLQRLSAREQALQTKVTTQQAELARLETEKRDRAKLIQQNEQLRQSLDEHEAEITLLQTRLAEAQKLTREMQVMQEQLANLQQDQQRLTTSLAGQQLEAGSLRNELNETKQRLSQRREELDTAKTELAKTRDELDQVRQSLAAQKNDSTVHALESRQRDLLAMIETQQQEMAWLEREMQDQQTQQLNELNEARRRDQRSQDQLSSRDEQIASLQKQLADAGQRLGELALADQRLGEAQAELQRREAEVERQRREIAALQNELTEQAARLERSSSEDIVIAQAVGPTIELIDPPLEATRGVFSINLRSNVPEVDVVGRVTPAERLYSFRVNDRDQQVEPNGVFKASIPVHTPKTAVSLVAVDKNAQRAAVDFLIFPKSGSNASPSKPKSEHVANAPGVRFGNYHALVIGNNNYRDMTNLSTAVNDARAVAGVLSEKYGFNTKLLLDANRYSMLSSLNELREQLTEKDNLLIYYAGHGELDKVNLRGYWLPVDAEADSSANWISNVAITDILNTMSAKHVLVVADSCYSGSMTRSSLARLQPGMSQSMREKWFRVMVKTRVRAVLTSGGVKPVLDSGGGDHSVFAKAFLDVLNENDGILEGFSLYREVHKRVKHLSATLRVDQDPQYAPIKYAGHEAGEFFFLPSSERIGMRRHPHSPVARIGSDTSGT